MPRPNQPRSIASEQALARRIAYERERLGMSPQGLAARMTKAGCPIQASAIYKIEKADPPRRITVDELVAFSQVFGVSIEHLLLPAEVVANNALVDLTIKWNRLQLEAWDAQRRADDAWQEMRAFLLEHPELRDDMEHLMSIWVGHLWPEDERPAQVARRMSNLTNDSEYFDAYFREHLATVKRNEAEES